MNLTRLFRRLWWELLFWSFWRAVLRSGATAVGGPHGELCLRLPRGPAGRDVLRRFSRLNVVAGGKALRVPCEGVWVGPPSW